MLSRTFSLIFALVSCSLWAKHPHTNKAEEATIERVKTLKVSSLDGNLPEVTLEFFLNYEGEGAPIKWRMSNCDQLKGNPVTDRERDPAICVEADIYLKDNRSATIIVSLGTVQGRPAGVPSVFSIAVSDHSGATRNVRRLGDLPMELHRPQPPHAAKIAQRPTSSCRSSPIAACGGKRSERLITVVTSR